YFIPPKFYQISLQLVQLCGKYYLYKQSTELYSYITKIKHILIFLMIMSAIEELILRLPMTECYIVHKHFLYIWLKNY
ncbi:hypothetical protein NAI35_12405, partial [Francisella tularensis subsp. holarctica]|nr:hypothetical protein [Francisella tularensis subsp. holarctica]